MKKTHNKIEDNEIQLKLKELYEQVEFEKSQKLKALADYDNLSKRVQKDVELIVFNRVSSLAKILLGIIDSSELALNEKDKVNEAWVTGVVNILSQLSGTLNNLGVSEILPNAGDDFNPEIHEAIGLVKNDKYENGKIGSIVQKGYIIEGKVIRQARVLLIKN